MSIRDKALISVETENGRLRFQISNRDKALEKRMEEIDRLKLEVAALKVSLQNERIRHQQCLNKLQVVFFVICSFFKWFFTCIGLTNYCSMRSNTLWEA